MNSRGTQQNAALQDLGPAGAANRGCGAGDEPREPPPRLPQRVGNRAGADIPGTQSQPVDELTADAVFVEFHAGEPDNACSGLMRHHEVHVAAGQVCIGKRLGDSG